MSRLSMVMVGTADPHLGRELRLLWVAIVVLASFLIALVAGGLSWIDSRRAAGAVLCGGVAFGSAIGVLLGLYTFVS